MGIINFKKPVALKGESGVNGVSWTNVPLSPGAECQFGGYKLVPSDGTAAILHCNAPPTPKLLFQALTQKTLKSSTKTFLNSFDLPWKASEILQGTLVFNRLPGTPQYSSNINMFLELDGVQFQFTVNNSTQNYLILDIANKKTEYVFTYTPTQDYINFVFYAENEKQNVTNELGPIFLKTS